MTVTSEECKVTYIGNGTTKQFSIPFVFFNDEISVLVNGFTPQGYSIVQNSLYMGYVSFTEAPADGDKISISRAVPLTQNTRFIEGENFPAEDYENSLDRIYMALQENKNLTEEKLNGYTKEEVDGLLENKEDKKDFKSVYVFDNRKVYLNEWKDSSVFDEYKYENTFYTPISLTKTNYRVSGNVVFSLSDAESGNFASVARFSIYMGDKIGVQISIYAKEKPLENITIPSVSVFVEEI